MLKAFPVFASLLLLLPFFVKADATHTDIFIPILEIEPKSPVAGQQVTISTVVTNRSNANVFNATLSYNLDGVWITDNVHVDLPAKKSVKVSFTIVIPVNPGEHQLRACPQRVVLGDDGDHCSALNFVAIDESTLTVTILSPKEEAVLRGAVTIKVAALGQNAEKVELYIENELVDTKKQVPFDFNIDTKKYENGQYRMYAIAYYDSGVSRISSVKKFVFDNSESVLVNVKPGSVQQAQVKAGQSVLLASDITNERPFKIAATLIVLVKDSNGYTEFIAWEEQKIPSMETIPMSRSWIAENKGLYNVQVFLWDTLQTAVPLADVMGANITVI